MRRLPSKTLNRERCVAVRSRRRPSGFTLVEMLVALSIFLILATLTLGAFRGVNKSDQVSAAAQQVKGWFENARSKALRDKQPRGIRFLADTTSATGSSPRMCTSIAYIGGAGFEDGDMTPALDQEKKYAWVQPVALPADPSVFPTGVHPAGTLISPGGTAFNRPPSAPTHEGYAAYVAWQAAMDSGALTSMIRTPPANANPSTAEVHGLRIEIPRNSGNWYPILTVGEADYNGDSTLAVVEDLNRSEQSGGNSTGRRDPVIVLAQPVANPEQYANRPLDYRIELGPTLLAETANPLPRGTVIDLDSSYVPMTWRPRAAGGPYSPSMDIMFSPNGTLIGQTAALQGVMHFCISTLEDANAARLDFPSAPPVPHPENSPSANPPYPFLLADPKTPQKLVSVFMNSGRVASSDVFIFATGDPAADGVNNTRLGSPPLFNDISRAFGYAVQGKEAK